MKKLAAFFFAVLIPGMTLAQDGGYGAGNEQGFRFGLKAMPTINWFKPDNTKKYENGGAVVKFTWGATLDFKLSNTAWLSTGLEVMYDGGKVNFLDSTYYFMFEDEFRTYDDFMGAGAAQANYDVFQLNTRKYNTTYINLPLNIKMKTKEIGFLNYYGLFGVTAGIKVKNKVDDLGNLNLATAEVENNGLDNGDDMAFFRAGLNIGGGAEWNLSGTTSIVFGLCYNLGFTNVVKDPSEFLNSVNLSDRNIEQKFNSHNIGISVGVLF
jgi:hypothetical protein